MSHNALQEALAVVREHDTQPEEGSTPAKRLRVVCAADVEPQTVEWLWPSWLPYGKLVVIDGAPGIGKSTLVTDLIARVSRGATMPGSDMTFAPINVMIGGVEDGWADTIRPRLDSAGADLSRVHFVDTALGSSLTVPRDVTELCAHAAELGVRWLHLDTIMGVLDESYDANGDNPVRRALGSLQQAAEHYGTLVTFIRHPRKAGGLAIHAGGGSIAFAATVRVGLFVGLDPREAELPEGDRQRILAVYKNNLARHPESLAFALESSFNHTAHVSWRGRAPGVTADQLAAPAIQTHAREHHAKPHPRQEERNWLRNAMADGRRWKVDDLKAAAHDAGYEWHRIKRAADDEGVAKARVNAFPSYAEWFFPPLPAQSEQPVPRLETSVLTVPTAPSVPTEALADVLFPEG